MKFLIAILMTLASGAYAQAPVEDGRLRGEQLQRDQFKAGNAYREMNRAEQAVRDAEQELRQAEAIQKDAQKRADEARRDAETARKKLDAAKLKEAQSRKAYDAAVNAVDRDANQPKKK
jgi:Tfp pilus assembly protein PilX